MLTRYGMMKPRRNLNQQHIAMIKCEIIAISLDDFVELHSQCNLKYKIDKQRYKLQIVGRMPIWFLKTLNGSTVKSMLFQKILNGTYRLFLCIFIQGRWQPTQSQLIQIYIGETFTIHTQHWTQNRTS